MKNKVILISIDGMRPDGMKGCGNPYVKELSLLDIAPTIAKLMSIEPEKEWEGRSVI